MKTTQMFSFWTIAYVGLHIYQAASQSTSCGDWTPYKNEKCLKIATRSGAQSKEDAEVICKTYADGANSVPEPKLLTVRSREEQLFVQRFLFNENEMIDNIWLELTKNRESGLFEWSDGSEVVFNNWANETLSDKEHECVEMESGDGILPIGLWLRVNCRRKNSIVCEKTPVLSLESLQTAFLSFKLQQEAKQNELEEKGKEMEQVLKNFEKKIEKSEEVMETLTQEISRVKNPVPLGFVYTQLPNQEPPSSLWPSTEWLEISPNYAGLFFRVDGEGTAPFGQIQESISPKLNLVESLSGSSSQPRLITIPSDGSWSNQVYTGSAGSDSLYFLKFQHSKDEVLPRNQAVKLWQRIK